tara:strand:- start:3854 stop:4183 length:330 start_codon:yes stop_codon:yes gene_type:complete
MNKNTKEFKPDTIIGVEEVGPGLREEKIVDLLFEGKMLEEWDHNQIIKNNQTIGIDFYEKDGDLEIDEIWNTTTGEVYREYNDLPENRMWTPGDELVVSSLLMWGELDG